MITVKYTIKEKEVMHKEGYYSSGESYAKANVTVRTIRYYDKQNILKPSAYRGRSEVFIRIQDFYEAAADVVV